MRCPYCGNDDTQVKDSRSSEDGLSIRRRRICAECMGRFTTFERVQLRDLVVLKASGAKEPFEREKMTRSIRLALRKRPVSEEQIEKLTSSLIRQFETLGDGEISTSFIGEMVLESLFELDQVGYIRYASVYKDFQDTNDFNQFIDKLTSTRPIVQSA